MPSSDQTMREAAEILRRVSPAARDLARRQRRRRQEALARRFRRVLVTAVAVVLGLAILGGVFGIAALSWLLLTLIFFAVVAGGMVLYPRPEEPTAQKLMETELPALPAKTEAWLAQQRLALPAPASRALGQIATRLEELRPQLQTIDPREPAAVEVRRLVGVELPELVEGYKRVPEHLRRDAGNGQSPERQLLDGLTIVEGEIERMTRQLASGELDALATQGKFLELKYRGDPEMDAER